MRVHSSAPLASAGAARLLVAALLATVPLIAWIGQATDLDLMLADAMFDFSAQVFPWRHAWLTETFNHGLLKALLTLAAAAFIGCALVDALEPAPQRDALGRLRLRIVALAALVVPAAISILKQASASHCPWDLARYGGTQPYLRLLDSLPAGVAPGHCLPAGHASSALWLVALMVYWLPNRPRIAAIAAAATLGFGLLVGLLQQWRGAHFMTHTLWSMWIACAVVLALTLCLQRAPDYLGKR